MTQAGLREAVAMVIVVVTVFTTLAVVSNYKDPVTPEGLSTTVRVTSPQPAGDPLYVGDRLAVDIAIDAKHKEMEATLARARALVAEALEQKQRAEQKQQEAEARTAELERESILRAGNCEHETPPLPVPEVRHRADTTRPIYYTRVGRGPVLILPASGPFFGHPLIVPSGFNSPFRFRRLGFRRF